MRFLAIDLGTKRTGLAVGDDVVGIVTPIDQISRPLGESLLDAILSMIELHQPAALVLGLPLNMDGTEGPAAEETRTFGNQLEERSRLPVYYQDERLSSYDADQQLAGSGRTHKQKKLVRDSLAAATILRDFLSQSPK